MQFRRIVNVLAVGLIVVAPRLPVRTKKFVRTEVDAVGTRVETLSQSLETTQEATRQNQAASRRSMRRPIRSASGRRTPRLRPPPRRLGSRGRRRESRRRGRLDEAPRV